MCEPVHFFGENTNVKFVFDGSHMKPNVAYIPVKL